MRRPYALLAEEGCCVSWSDILGIIYAWVAFGKHVGVATIAIERFAGREPFSWRGVVDKVEDVPCKGSLGSNRRFRVIPGQMIYLNEEADLQHLLGTRMLELYHLPVCIRLAFGQRFAFVPACYQQPSQRETRVVLFLPSVSLMAVVLINGICENVLSSAFCALLYVVPSCTKPYITLSIGTYQGIITSK